MTGKPLSTQKKAALWRAYKQRQTANYVATHCKVSPHTAEKYIRELNFSERYARLLAKANELVDEDQAKSLAEDIKTTSDIKTFIADTILEALKNKTFKPSTADYGRMVRLERYLRSEPEARTEDVVSWEWLEEVSED
jgi:hypothetical protein